MKTVVRGMLTLGLALLLCRPGLAAEPATPATDAVNAQAVKLLDQGQAEEAYRLLQAKHATGQDDVETTFLLGQSAMLLKRPAEAARLYEGILAKDPKLPRVRLELGRAYAAMGKTEKAQEQFQAVLVDTPPPAVGENIRKFLASMESQKKWNVRGSAGYIYDSNVNAGPPVNTVLMFGVPFQLDKDSKEKSDSGYTASLEAGYLLDLSNNVTLQADVSYNRVGYEHLHEYNSDVFSGSLGPTLEKEAFILSAPVVAEYVQIGQERYSYAFGLAPQVLVPITERLVANASVVGQKKHYYVNDGIRNGTIWSATAGARYYCWQNGFVQASYRHAEERTEEDYLDNHSNGGSLGFYTGLPAGFFLYLAPGISFTRYDEAEAAFDDRRRDIEYTVVANLSKEFGTTGLSAAIGYTFTRNDSNLGLYDYDRNQLTAQLSWAF